jgi:hypothetical protein
MRTYAPKANQITISTRCRSTEQFIGTFRRYATAGSIFIATLIERTPGAETGFSFALADGTPVLRGTGVVIEVWKTVDNRYRLPGFELGIKWLSPRSVAVFRQLLIPRRLSATMKSVAPPPAQSTSLKDDQMIPPPPPGVPHPAGDASKTEPMPAETSPRPGVPLLVATESWSGPTRTETKRPLRSVSSPSKVPPPIPAAPRSAAKDSWSAPTRTETRRRVTPPPPVKTVALPRGDDETEPVTPVTPAEVRTAASDVSVPTNPLANLTDVSIDGFVECTLYEEPVPQPIGKVADPATESIRPSRRWMLHVALVSAATGSIVLGSDAVPSEANPTSRDRGAAASEVSTNVIASPSNDQGPLVVGDGPCRLDVSSTPTGAMVALDGVRQGESPIAMATTCGRHRVVISEEHHQTMAAWVTLAIEQPERIKVSLARPIHAVAVTTKPSGAAIYIDGSPAGTTPTTLNILGHVPMSLEIKKAGYQPLIQHLYSTTPLDKVAIQMIKASPRRR